MDARKIAAQLKWLKLHPEYEEMPATILEFLGPEYLDIRAMVRPGLRQALVEIFGEEVNPERISNFERAMVTGGIGIGKSTFASIAIPYMVHHTLCLRDPQGFYGLMPGSRIAFMQMSTSAKQATEVIFGDLKARVDHSPWFINNYPYDDKWTKQMRFAKDVWILPGGSDETSFEGYNILGGILEEMDSHKISDNKDYADVGYNTIHSRIGSRFIDLRDPEYMGHRGLLICIGQMKKANGFAARKLAEFKKDKRAYVMRMTIWQSFGWDKFSDKATGERKSFWYNTKTKKIIPTLAAKMVNSDDVIEVPLAYKPDFENNPEKALRDLAGIPPATDSPFISLVDRIEECAERWEEHHSDSPSPVQPDPERVHFEPWFKANGNPLKRVSHLDFATSGDGDAFGIAMGHVSSLVKIDEEEKPYITIDFLARIKARAGNEIFLADVRNLLYDLRYEMGFRLKYVSMDGFQSTDTSQQLRKRKFNTEYVSVDKSKLPYEDLRDAIYERRIEWPRYITYLHPGDTDKVEILLRELMEIIDTGKKVDHPPGGSKDVADAVAAVTTVLMGDRTYRKGLHTAGTMGREDELPATGTEGGTVLAFPGIGNLQMPVPAPGSLGGSGFVLPNRLRPNR